MGHVTIFWVTFVLSLCLFFRFIVKEKWAPSIFFGILFSAGSLGIMLVISCEIFRTKYDLKEDSVAVYNKAATAYSMTYDEEDFVINIYDTSSNIRVFEFMYEDKGHKRLLQIKETDLEVVIIDGVKPYFKGVNHYYPKKLPGLLHYTIPVKWVQRLSDDPSGFLYLDKEPKLVEYVLTRKNEGGQ
jgi:hypothetical protein